MNKYILFDTVSDLSLPSCALQSGNKCLYPCKKIDDKELMNLKKKILFEFELKDLLIKDLKTLKSIHFHSLST